MITKEYGLRTNTIYNYFKKNGIKLRSVSEATNLAILEGRESPPSSKCYKNVWHTTWNKNKVYLRSSYELDYAKKLDKLKIEYSVEKIRIKYYDSIKKCTKIAIPDFYLPKSNTLVEIKSTYTYNNINMEDKIKAYLKSGYNFKLILDKKETININKSC